MIANAMQPNTGTHRPARRERISSFEGKNKTQLLLRVPKYHGAAGIPKKDFRKIRSFKCFLSNCINNFTCMDGKEVKCAPKHSLNA